MLTFKAKIVIELFDSVQLFMISAKFSKLRVEHFQKTEVTFLRLRWGFFKLLI